MRTRRRFIDLAGSALFVLAGCGGEPSTTADSGTPSPAAGAEATERPALANDATSGMPGVGGATTTPGPGAGSSGQTPGGAAGQPSSAGGSGAAGGAAGAPVVTGDCSFGAATMVQSFEPELFSNGDDPSGTAACQEVLNPERGVFHYVDFRSPGNLSSLRDAGYTLIYGQTLIDDYRESDIDAALLSTLSDSFQAARDAGIKVLPRFYYAADGTAPDAPLDRVLSHIEQLTPLLQDNSDVIAALHAGFVGAWGEWHSSTNNLTEPDARKTIFDALLAALPDSRMVLARRPSHKQEAYGGPLTEATAYAGDALSRIGHLNDCFLATENDTGTYQLDGEKDFAIADSAFTAVGGETCGVNPPRSECASAMDEMALLHWSFINTDYHPDVIASWQTGGCFDTIHCRLGYRFALLGHESPTTIAAGDTLSLSLSLLNDGYARPVNPRPAYLVLDGPERVTLPVDLDLRRVALGEPAARCLGAELPADLSAGDYRLGLWFPDAAPSLQDDARYALRFSNDVSFEDGVNFLDVTVTVTN